MLPQPSKSSSNNTPWLNSEDLGQMDGCGASGTGGGAYAVTGRGGCRRA